MSAIGLSGALSLLTGAMARSAMFSCANGPGCPQLGQAVARLEICFLQSGQVINMMMFSVGVIERGGKTLPSKALPQELPASVFQHRSSCLFACKKQGLSRHVLS
jgi:hypothetical protein